jgi:putative membrane protein
MTEMMGQFGYGPWAMLLGGLMMLLFWGGLIVLVVWALRQFAGRPTGEDPTAILKRRLAAGEITREQYEQSRKALQG